MKLSVIIVNYNVTQLLDNCLGSVVKFFQGISYEIIVVDNCSADQSWKNLIDKYPKFVYLFVIVGINLLKLKRIIKAKFF